MLDPLTGPSLLDEFHHLYYGPGVAPFGELSILVNKPLPEGSPDGMFGSFNRTSLTVTAGAIASHAWSNTDWLRAELADDSVEIDDVMPLGVSVEASVAVAMAGRFGRHGAYAVRPSVSAEDDELEALIGPLADGFISYSQVAGFATSELSLGSSFKAAFLETFRPHRAERPIMHLNVRPEEQGKKLGAALLGAVLSLQDRDHIVTTYVPTAAHTLINKLGENGFRAVKQASLKNYLVDRDQPLAFTKLEAHSVGETLQNLGQAYPWIQDAVVLR
ncbi:MAG: hypothetical protein JWN38_952 [Candidatus Saccharibacteria bacterium]|nr:hypothetical protein [Candidatus Saccharibacteria bacterium]